MISLSKAAVVCVTAALSSMIGISAAASPAPQRDSASYRIVLHTHDINDHRCLTSDPNGTGDNGDEVVVGDCADGDYQEWQYIPVPETERPDGFEGIQLYYIRNVLGGRCLDVPYDSGSNAGTATQLWDCNPSVSEMWELTKLHPNPELELHELLSARFPDNGGPRQALSVGTEDGVGAPVRIQDETESPDFIQFWN